MSSWNMCSWNSSFRCVQFNTVWYIIITEGFYIAIFRYLTLGFNVVKDPELEFHVVKHVISYLELEKWHAVICSYVRSRGLLNMTNYLTSMSELPDAKVLVNFREQMSKDKVLIFQISCWQVLKLSCFINWILKCFAGTISNRNVYISGIMNNSSD